MIYIKQGKNGKTKNDRTEIDRYLNPAKMRHCYSADYFILDLPFYESAL